MKKNTGLAEGLWHMDEVDKHHCFKMANFHASMPSLTHISFCDLRQDVNGLGYLAFAPISTWIALLSTFPFVFYICRLFFYLKCRLTLSPSHLIHRITAMI